jgi:regulator of protease activity HflC (stomatin/prohibitin superfamily)
MLMEILQGVTGIFVVVYDGQHALKFELGRAKNIVGPGVHFKWPIIQRFKVRDTRDTTLDLEPQIIQLRDDLVFEVDAKLIYQIVDLRKAMIEVDDLVQGLKNRVTIAIQKVVKAQNRETIGDLNQMVEQVLVALKPVEDQWGIAVREFGFSNFAPTPATLEITQLRLLAQEKLDLYREFREQGLGNEASVSLISGAVVTMKPQHPSTHEKSWKKKTPDDDALEQVLEAVVEALEDEDDTEAGEGMEKPQ